MPGLNPHEVLGNTQITSTNCQNPAQLSEKADHPVNLPVTHSTAGPDNPKTHCQQGTV